MNTSEVIKKFSSALLNEFIGWATTIDIEINEENFKHYLDANLEQRLVDWEELLNGGEVSDEVSTVIFW
mgnify:CR=1 FL=1